MIMYHDCDALDAFGFSRIFTDERYQGKSYGKAAIQLVLDTMKEDGKYSKVSCVTLRGIQPQRTFTKSLVLVNVTEMMTRLLWNSISDVNKLRITVRYKKRCLIHSES